MELRPIINVRFSFCTGVRFSVLSCVMGTSVRFVVLASVTFLNSISVSSVDSWPSGYLTGVGRRLPTLAEASTERDLKRYPSPDPRTGASWAWAARPRPKFVVDNVTVTE